MHLVYLYVENFRCLKKASLNFDSNYKFGVEDHVIRLLSEKDQKISLSHFFALGGRSDKGCVSNVNAIIGPNGSGKTTLAFVLQQLARGEPVIGDCIAIFKNDENDPSSKEFYYCCSVEKGREQYVADSKWSCRGEHGPFRLWRKMVYYSPLYSPVHVIDGDPETDEDRRRVFDVSTTAQMRKMRSTVLSEGEGARMISSNVIYDAVEIRSVLETLNVAELKAFFRVVPVGVRIEPNKYALARYQQDARSAMVSSGDLDKMIATPLFDEDVECRHAVIGAELEWASRTGRLTLAFVLYAASVCKVALDKKEIGPGRPFATYARTLYVFCKSLMRVKGGDDAVLLKINEFLKEQLVLFEGARFDSYRGVPFKGVLSGALHAINALCALPMSSRVEHKMGPIYHDFLLEGEEGRPVQDKVLSLIADHSVSALHMDYLSFELIPPLSSGEIAFLSMFGRILNALREMRCSQGGVCPVLLFLDEAETALHPEWQRNLVRNMIEFCERCTVDMDVQIAFASHSPLLLSDIPKGNVCVLYSEQSEKGTANELGPDRLGNTFCANIFDLYRCSFVFRESAFGSFAEKKVQDVLDKIQGRANLDAVDKFVIANVGEPILQNYLLGMCRKLDIRGATDFLVRVSRGEKIPNAIH